MVFTKAEVFNIFSRIGTSYLLFSSIVVFLPQDQHILDRKKKINIKLVSNYKCLTFIENIADYGTNIALEFL
jgi:hypothetical protein